MGSFLGEVIKSKSIIWELVKKDMKSKYLGSYLGVFWAFIHPTIIILIYWFVFQVGFKSLPVGDIPFILWLMTGIVPWFFFSEAVSSATSSIIENSFLVKKVVFRVSILPIIKIISALFIHIFFISVLFLIFSCYSYKPTLYYFQIVYYMSATFFLILGISWITSSLVVFLKDIGQFVGMFMQLFFWVTPIFWNLKIAPQEYWIFFKLNPVYYIVQGFRDTFIYQHWFWEHPYLTVYFWGVTILLLLIGAKIFGKLRSHFADVL